jgi:hypothetical protein
MSTKGILLDETFKNLDAAIKDMKPITDKYAAGSIHIYCHINPDLTVHVKLTVSKGMLKETS